MKPREKGFPIINKKGNGKRKKRLWTLTKLMAIWYLFLGIVAAVTGQTNAYYTDVELVNQEIQIGTWEIAEDMDCSNANKNEDHEECEEMKEPIEDEPVSNENQENESDEPETEENEEAKDSDEKVDDSTKDEVENKPEENEAIDKEKEESELPIEKDSSTKNENTDGKVDNKPGGEEFEKNAESNK